MNDSTVRQEQAAARMLDANMGGAVVQNSFKAVSNHLRSTGFRTARIGAEAPGSAALTLAYDFLVNSQYRRGDREFEVSVENYFLDSSQLMLSLNGRRERRRGAEHVLPPPLTLRMPIGEVMQHRRSQREFTKEALSFAQIGTLLRAGNGVSGIGTVELMDGRTTTIPFRTTPSGGGTFPVTLIIAVFRAEGIEPGVYAFDPLNNSIVAQADKGMLPELKEALADTSKNGVVDRASLGILFRSEVARSTRKYGVRGLRFVLQECGYIAQNIHLTAVALGIGSLDWGGFHDDGCHKALGLDGLNEAVLHCMLAGVV